MICRLFFYKLYGIKRQGRVVCLDNTSPFFRAFLGQKIETSMLFRQYVSLSLIKNFCKNICTLKKLLYLCSVESSRVSLYPYIKKIS